MAMECNFLVKDLKKIVVVVETGYAARLSKQDCCAPETA